MRFADADVLLVGLLLAATLALAGYALGASAAEAAGASSPGRVTWSDLDPRAWLAFPGMVVSAPATPA